MSQFKATAGEVADALQILVQALNNRREVEIPGFRILAGSSYSTAKKQFLNLARLLPRPVEKTYSDNTLELKISLFNDAVILTHSIARNEVCTQLSPAIPAKWSCEPLLSSDEANELIDVKEFDE